MLQYRHKLIPKLVVGAIAALLCIVAIAPAANAMPITFETGTKVATFDTDRCHLIALEGFKKALTEGPHRVGVTESEAKRVSQLIDQAIYNGEYIAPPAPAKFYGLSVHELESIRAQMSNIQFQYRSSGVVSFYSGNPLTVSN